MAIKQKLQKAFLRIYQSQQILGDCMYIAIVELLIYLNKFAEH